MSCTRVIKQGDVGGGSTQQNQKREHEHRCIRDSQNFQGCQLWQERTPCRGAAATRPSTAVDSAEAVQRGHVVSMQSRRNQRSAVGLARRMNECMHANRDEGHRVTYKQQGMG